MSSAGDDRAPRVRPPVAVALATVVFATLVIFGFGMLSLALDEDVIAMPGLGQVPGILSLSIAAVSFAVLLAIALRQSAPSFWAVAWITPAVFLVYLATLWIGAVGVGAGIAAAAAIAGRVATTWFGAVPAGAAAVAAWGGMALVRTRADRPRWPWEHDDDE
ncbi:hypothetical protein GCM10009775_21920 [Microbacterium aoyamense]|uniref:Uncharacterized protein n=1 Tax=Microbacterium aoyamense TaxID=344166 RepID=A0ABN2PUF1_9MICO|nr:hypothetical protein [Microbacterium aoyamense]